MAKRAKRTGGKNQTVKDFVQGIGDDLKDEIEVNLNGFISSIITDLTSDGLDGGVSPVLTGFFASSWKAGQNVTERTYLRESVSPWSKIKTTNVNGTIGLAPGHKPYIKQRHPVPNNFELNKSIYIGNTSKYAHLALKSGKSKVFPYLSGGSGGFKEGLNQKVDRFFTDKRPSIRVATGFSNTGGFNFKNL